MLNLRSTVRLSCIIRHNTNRSLLIRERWRQKIKFNWWPLSLEKGGMAFYFIPFRCVCRWYRPRFVLKDDQTTTNGNYLYAQIYDASKRAETGTNLLTGNPCLRHWGLEINWSFKKIKAISYCYRRGLQPIRCSPLPPVRGYSVWTLARKFNYPYLITAIGRLQALRTAVGVYGKSVPSPMWGRPTASRTSLGNFIYWYNGSTCRVFDAGGSGVIPAYGAFLFKTTAQTDVSLKTRDLPVVKGEAFSSSNSFIEYVAGRN